MPDFIITITAKVNAPIMPPEDYKKNFAHGFIQGFNKRQGWNCQACNVEVEKIDA